MGNLEIQCIFIEHKVSDNYKQETVVNAIVNKSACETITYIQVILFLFNVLICCNVTLILKEGRQETFAFNHNTGSYVIAIIDTRITYSE